MRYDVSRIKIHGKASGYFRGCRCDACLEVGRAWWREYNVRRGRTKVVGAARNPREPHQCEQCQGEFLEYRKRGRRFCSVSCAAKARVVHEHGSTMYRHGCRCDICRQANAARCRAYQRKKRAG